MQHFLPPKQYPEHTYGTTDLQQTLQRSLLQTSVMKFSCQSRLERSFQGTERGREEHPSHRRSTNPTFFQRVKITVSFHSCQQNRAREICEATQLQNMIADDNLPMYKNQSPFPGHANRRTYKNKALSPELQSKLCHQTLAPRLNTSAKSDKHL